MKKKWMVLLLVLISCHKQENAYRPSSQELRFNLHVEPPTLDPRKAVDTVSISILNLCFEGLMRTDAEGQLIFGAAEKMTVSEDKKIYTFTLRDAKWSDGKRVTAHDFERTWKTILDPLFPSELAMNLYILKNGKAAKAKRCSLDDVGVKALDEKTLQVELEYPIPYFLSVLATHCFFATPQHITNAFANWTQEHYVGNGPFFLQEWRHHHAMILQKNPQYWDRDNVRLEKVEFALVEDETTELTMFENGELDWAGFPFSNLPTEALDQLGKKGELQSYDIAGTYYYIFNTKQIPFSNVNIRRAFALAINREAIVANVTQMQQMPAMGLIPPVMWDYHEPYFHDHDVEEAKRLFALGLQELGMRREDLPELTLSYNTLVGHHKIAQAIQQQWKEIFDVKVRLENKEWKVFLDELSHHQFQIARMGGLAHINDPISFLDFYRYLSSSNNYPQWSNPLFSDLLEKADRTADADKRFTILKEAEKIMMQEMPIAPIYYYRGAYLKKPYVKGIHLSELNDLDLKWAYVELDDQISR